MRRQAPCRGFTLIELMMVVAIVGMLTTLSLPALSRAREAGRRLQCLSNLRQVGLAVIQEEARRGRFPASGNFSSSGPEQYHSWVVGLLRDLDRPDLADGWDFNEPHDDVKYSDNGRLARTSITILTCPSDFSVVPGEGNLSFAVNGGIGWTEPVDCPISPHWAGIPHPTKTPFDFNGDGRTCKDTSDPTVLAPDKRLYLQTGLFFVENWPYGTGGTSRHHSLTSVTDGSATTLMLTENVRAGFDPVWQSNWSDPWPPRSSIFLSGYVCRSSSCGPGNVDYGQANVQAGGPATFESINAALDQAEGEAPWPSSAHGGGVNVILCDGHGRFLRQSVAGAVYAALLSPQGMRINNPALRQVIPGDDWE
jgi:prepilin-type N-terminal cleavage/methylation domain-containing protein/prepilin-type processing-associated H-X9-DG protein